MAILIEKELNISGIVVPAGTMIKPAFHYPPDLTWVDSKGKFQHQRCVTYDNFVYSSLAEFQKNSPPIIGISAIPSSYTKQISDSEFDELMKNGYIAEEWLKNEMNLILGGEYCSIIDPYKK